MQVGLSMFPTEYAIHVAELAHEAEAHGFESLFLPEHTHILTSRRSPWGGGPTLPHEYWHTHDPFVTPASPLPRRPRSIWARASVSSSSAIRS